MQTGNGHQWVVMKFGGTSVASADCWGTICNRARNHLDSGKHVLVVVSALSGMTNLLTRLAEGVGKAEKEQIRVEIDSRHERLCQQLSIEAPADVRS